ncbi:MAG: hypothetical protein WKF47_04315 [Geodermatophilaceae bacterium]
MRFTSPHPRDFTDDVIEAMATTANVCPQLHMPLQSGSDDVLAPDAPLVPPGPLPGDPRPGTAGDPARRDHHRHHRRLSRGDRGRLRRPRCSLVQEARFASAYTFQYSVRAGTPAATLPDQVPKDVVQERYERLVEVQRRISHEENEALVGCDVEVLVADRGGQQGLSDRSADRTGARRAAGALSPFRPTPMSARATS